MYFWYATKTAKLQEKIIREQKNVNKQQQDCYV